MPARTRWFSVFRKWIAAVAVAALTLGSPAAAAQGAEDASAAEQRVKAAFLYQFSAYVQWPPEAFATPDAPVVIAVAGAARLAADLAQIANGRTVNGRPVSIRQVRAGDSLSGVHILFIGRADPSLRAQLLPRVRMLPILVVTETEGALGEGSMINFIMTERRVRFEIALDTAEKSGLRLSSRLLSVAADVRTAGGR